METGNKWRSPVSESSDLSRPVLIVLRLFFGLTCFHFGTKHILVDIYISENTSLTFRDNYMDILFWNSESVWSLSMSTLELLPLTKLCHLLSRCWQWSAVMLLSVDHEEEVFNNVLFSHVIGVFGSGQLCVSVAWGRERERDWWRWSLSSERS